jgi:cytochrome c biogenesis protein CcmG/thiol:disulfide interchange protein DsbE
MSAQHATPEAPLPSRSAKIWRSAKEWGLSLGLAAVVFHLVGQLRAPDLPDEAPDFTLPVLDGGSVTLSELKGQPVVLNFWAPWCGPCRAEVPQFSRFAKSHPEVHVLGVATDGAPAELRASKQKLGMDYPVVIADSATSSAYGVSILPTTVIVDADGRISTAHAGILTLPQLEMMVP